MKRYRYAASVALGLVTLLALAGPVAARETKPFRGSYEGTVAILPLTPPFVDALLEGTGHANHLGRFTVIEPHRVNLETATGISTYTFVAANGDTLTASGTASATPTDVPNVLFVVEHATITGGTGRFAGATGHFTIERLQTTTAEEITVSCSIEGTLSLR
jgi:hypothetical protein